MPSGTITALRAQAHDSQRINVFINDAFAIGVSQETLVAEKLYVGKSIDEADYARLEQRERAHTVMQAALRLLEVRPRSAAELRDRLRRKEYPPAAIDRALERLTELGLLDDAAFARSWVENRQALRPRGSGALRNELRRKGVAPAIVEAVLEEDALVGDQAARALELARAALHKYANAPDAASFTRRLGGYLQRRGFGFETIRPIIDQLWSELRPGQVAPDQ